MPEYEKRIDIGKLQDAIGEILQEYGDQVYTLTEDGLDTAEEILIRNLRANSPKHTGDFAKAWKSKGRKYKLMRIIGNSKTVKGKSKKGKVEEIPLANIFEYSTTKGQPFIEKTFEESIPAMAEAIVESIKKGGS